MALGNFGSAGGPARLRESTPLVCEDEQSPSRLWDLTGDGLPGCPRAPSLKFTFRPTLSNERKHS